MTFFMGFSVFKAIQMLPLASLFGPEGIWSYDIQGTAYMVVVAWSVPQNDGLYEEKFNVKVFNKTL